MDTRLTAQAPSLRLLVPAGTAAPADSVPGRRRRRERQIRRTIAWSLVSRAVTVLSQLAILPLTLGCLGTEKFGLWVTITTALAWLNVINASFANGLQNPVGRAAAVGDRAQSQRDISTVFWSFQALALALFGLWVVVFPRVNWLSLLKLADAPPHAEVKLTLFLAGVLACAQLPWSVVAPVYNAHQEGYVVTLSQAAAAALTLAAVWLATQAGSPMHVLAGALLAPALVVQLGNALYLFGWHKPWLRPSLGGVNTASFRAVYRQGSQFLLIQIGGLVVYYTNAFILLRVVDARAVALYSVTQQMVLLVTSLHTVFLTPIWAAYTDAAARQDWAWMGARLRQTLLLTGLIGSVPLLLIAGTGDRLVWWWTGGRLRPEAPIVWGAAAWALVYMIDNCFTMFLYGIGAVKYMSLLALVVAPLDAVLCVVWAGWYGILGVQLGNLVVMVLAGACFAVETMLRWRRLTAGRRGPLAAPPPCAAT